MKVFYVTVTSPADPTECIRGLIAVDDDGKMYGGDSTTVWLGQMADDGTFNLTTTEKVPGAPALLSSVTGKLTIANNAATATGSGIGAQYPFKGATMPLNFKVEVLKG